MLRCLALPCASCHGDGARAFAHARVVLRNMKYIAGRSVGPLREPPKVNEQKVRDEKSKTWRECPAVLSGGSGRGRALHWQSGTNKCTRILLERGENGRWDVKLFCRDTIKRWLESRLLSALKTCACGCLWSCSASALPPTQTVYLLFIFYTHEKSR